jgi:hypothetical protein
VGEAATIRFADVLGAVVAAVVHGALASSDARVSLWPPLIVVAQGQKLPSVVLTALSAIGSTMDAAGALWVTARRRKTQWHAFGFRGMLLRFFGLLACC